MSDWTDFAAQSPEIARAGRLLLDGRISHLATRLVNGSSRIVPVMPDLTERDLFLFLEAESPSARDLEQDDRYALHAVVDRTGDALAEYWILGRARLVDSAASRARAEAASEAKGYRVDAANVLYSLTVEHAMLDKGGERQRWDEE